MFKNKRKSKESSTVFRFDLIFQSERKRMGLETRHGDGGGEYTKIYGK